jgi:hypothetical protein
VTAKAQLREEGKERQEELKALELKRETGENSVLWSLESLEDGALQKELGIKSCYRG